MPNFKFLCNYLTEAQFLKAVFGHFFGTVFYLCRSVCGMITSNIWFKNKLRSPSFQTFENSLPRLLPRSLKRLPIKAMPKSNTRDDGLTTAHHQSFLRQFTIKIQLDYIHFQGLVTLKSPRRKAWENSSTIYLPERVNNLLIANLTTWDLSTNPGECNTCPMFQFVFYLYKHIFFSYFTDKYLWFLFIINIQNSILFNIWNNFSLQFFLCIKIIIFLNRVFDHFTPLG